MISLDVAIDDTVITHIQSVARALPDLAKRYVQKDVRPLVSNLVDQRLRRPPPPLGPGDYPIPWTTEKQRRWFFWHFAPEDLPIRRSGELERAWQVRVDYEHGFAGITVRNPKPHALYVYGDARKLHQQPFHLRTGWPTFQTEIQVISIEVGDWIEDGWPSVLQEALEAGA